MSDETRMMLVYYKPDRKLSYIIAPVPASWTLDLLEYASDM